MSTIVLSDPVVLRCCSVLLMEWFGAAHGWLCAVHGMVPNGTCLHWTGPACRDPSIKVQQDRPRILSVIDAPANFTARVNGHPP